MRKTSSYWFLTFIVLVAINVLVGTNPSNPLNAQDAELISTSLAYPTTSPITGRIVDESGRPIMGAVVIQYSKSTGSSYWYFGGGKDAKHEICNRATTDILGRFKFKEWDFDHNTRVYVVHSGYPITQIRNKLSIFGDTVLKKGTDISGRILTRDGKPVKDAEVELPYLPDKEITKISHGTTKTDSNGAFTLKNAGVDGKAYLQLKVKDRFYSGLTWFENDDKPGVAQSQAHDPKSVMIGNDFEYRLPELRPIHFSVVSADSGKPVEVQAVFAGFSPIADGFNSYPSGHFYVGIDKNKIAYDFLKTGYNRFYIFPTMKSKHSPFFLDVPLSDSGEPPKDLIAKAPKGTQITGIVTDASSGKGIPNAPILFVSETPGAMLDQNHLPRERCFTDDDGRFESVLPAGRWKVRVSGDCGDYCVYPSNLEKDLPQSFQFGGAKNVKAKFTVPPELEKRLEFGEGETVDAGIFNLKKSVVAKGTVVDADGKPISNVAFISEPERYIFSRKRFGKTDKFGRFTIKNLFTNGIEDLPKSRNATSGEGKIFFWHHEKRMSAFIKVQKDDCDSIKVTLTDSPAAWGRVIDSISGKPLGGVRMFGNHTIGFLQMGAYTRDDGSYLLEYVPRQGIFLSCSKPKYKHESLRIDFTAADKDVLVLEVPDFKMRKLGQYAFGTPDKPDITGLSPLQTVDALTVHIAKQLEKIPEDPDPNRWGSDDPDTQFKFKVSKDVSEVVERLLDENKDPSYQVALSTKILSALSVSKGGSMIMHNGGVRRMRKILLKNLDREGVLATYKAFTFTTNGSDLTLTALESSQSSAARLWAASQLLNEANSDLANSIQLGVRSTSQATFEYRFANAKKAWSTLLSEFPDVPVYGSLNYKGYTGQRVRAMIGQTQSRPHHEERLQTVVDAANALGLLADDE